MSLSLRGENCVASLFVRFFTSLVMSTQIKMTIQSGGVEAQLPPLRLFHFVRKEKCNECKNPVHKVACMCIYVSLHVSFSLCTKSEVVFGMRGDNFEV